jgi:hypothetical protein
MKSQIRIAQDGSNSDQASSASRHDTHILPRVLTLLTLAVIVVVQIRNCGAQRLDAGCRAIFSRVFAQGDGSRSWETLEGRSAGLEAGDELHCNVHHQYHRLLGPLDPNWPLGCCQDVFPRRQCSDYHCGTPSGLTFFRLVIEPVLLSLFCSPDHALTHEISNGVLVERGLGSKPRSYSATSGRVERGMRFVAGMRAERSMRSRDAFTFTFRVDRETTAIGGRVQRLSQLRNSSF